MRLRTQPVDRCDANWRLELSLNELGRSFMVVDDFAMQQGLLLTPED